MTADQQSDKALFHHTIDVSHQERVKLKGHAPCVIWFTGLSGAGKSTLANALERTLNDRGCHTYLLDGDNLRTGISNDLGFSKQDREENIRRVGEISRLMVDAGVIVLTALISPYHESRNRVRQRFNHGEFIEVHVNTPLSVCEQRDTKGLYQKARQGLVTNFTGIDSAYEAPDYPEIEIDTSQQSVASSVEQLLTYLGNLGVWPRS